jgi:D-inositol-3-phosphate glycosyltransferase
MRIAMVSEHANPLATVGGVDAGGQNVHVGALAAELVRRGHEVTVFTRRDSVTAPLRVTATEGYVVEHVAAGPPHEIPKDELWQHMPRFAEHLGRSWRSAPVDVVHAHFWMSGVASAVAARELRPFTPSARSSAVTRVPGTPARRYGWPGSGGCAAPWTG